MRIRKLVVGLMTVPLVTSMAATGSPASAQQLQKTDSFWCYGSFQVVNRITFGGAGWIQETGRRSDGARAIRVYHPSFRTDEYRFRFGNGQTLGYRLTSDHCIVLNSGDVARPEARNGGQWWEGQWRQG